MTAATDLIPNAATSLVLTAAADRVLKHGLHKGNFWPDHDDGAASIGQPCCAAGAILIVAGDGSGVGRVFADYLVRTGLAARCCDCGAGCSQLSCVDTVETIAGWNDTDGRTKHQVAAALWACATEVAS